MICPYTKLIHDRGWTVRAACDHWEMRYDVWRRMCRNARTKKTRLISMCRGLEKQIKEG